MRRHNPTAAPAIPTAAPGHGHAAPNKDGGARPAAAPARPQDGAGRRCCVRGGSKMAPSRPRCPHPRWLHPLQRRGSRPARPRRRPQAVSALTKDGGGQRRWSLGSRHSLLAGLRGRHGGGRAGVRVRSLREARCQRLPHPAAHLQPRVQVRERAAPAIAPGRPVPPQPVPAGQPAPGLCQPCPGLAPRQSRVLCSPAGPAIPRAAPSRVWRSRRLELPLVGRGASAPCPGGAGAALLSRGRR